MAEVGVAVGAEQFRAAHAVGVVEALLDAGVLELRVVAGPAAAGVEFGARVEQRMITADAVVDAFFEMLVVLAAERPFGARLAGHPKGLVIQLLTPFLFGLVHIAHAVSSVGSWIDQSAVTRRRERSDCDHPRSVPSDLPGSGR